MKRLREICEKPGFWQTVYNNFLEKKQGKDRQMGGKEGSLHGDDEYQEHVKQWESNRDTL